MEMEEKLEGLRLKNYYKDFILQYYDEIDRNGNTTQKALKYKAESSGSLGYDIKSQPDKMEKMQFNPTIIRKVLDTLKGQSVIARNDKDGFYYPGTVVKCPDPRHAVIKFEADETKTVPTRQVIAMGGAIACPMLRAGDYVLVRVQYTAKSDCYVPGIVQVVPMHEAASNKFYTVLLFNGQQATTCRSFLMKISKSRFDFAIRYIADIQNIDSQQYEDKVYVTPRTPRTPRPSDKEKRVRTEVKSKPSKKTEYRSRSKSSESSRSRSRSSSHSRSRSRSPKQSTSRSRSRSQSRDRSRSRSRSYSSRSRTPSPEFRKDKDPEPKKRSERLSKKNKRSTSRSSSRSSSRSRSSSADSRKRSRSNIVKSPIERPPTPVLGQHEEEEEERKRQKEKKRKHKMKELKKMLLQQQEEQEKQQKMIRHQRKKMKKLKKRLKKKKKRGGRSNDSFAPNGLSIQVESSSDVDSDDSRRQSYDNEKSDDTTQIPSLLRLRKSLPRLREGEEVLARWSDEGWYFRGVIREDCGDYSYIVEDATHQVEKIWREDIITDYDDANQVLQPKDPVVALYPHYSFSYAPGVILEVYHNMWMKIRLYDGEETKIPRDEAFKLTSEKFEHDVNYIIECETRWIGQAVVARDDRYGTYHLASVQKRIGNGREYLLEWCDGSLSQQNSIHIFGVYTKHHRLAVGDHVLAMMDDQQHMYLPGWIGGIVGDKINIKFCDGSLKDVDDVLQCFWLSNDYYDNAVQFFKKCQDLETDDATTNKEEY